MGTIGGNLLQRTRCGYFRDTGFACNKRAPGSGCPAITGENRLLAVLGGSDHCIATHASDLAVALAALDAVVELQGVNGNRRVPIGEFYRLPGDTPHIETVLEPGEMITAVAVPGGRNQPGDAERLQTDFAATCGAARVADGFGLTEARQWHISGKVSTGSMAD
jgi:CO/xanthine dehydrogenase FAD-binding subunit